MNWILKHRFLSAALGILVLALLAHTIGGVIGRVIQILLAGGLLLEFTSWLRNRKHTKETNNAKE